MGAGAGAGSRGRARTGRNASPPLLLGSVGAKRAKRPKKTAKTSPRLTQAALPNNAMPPQVTSEYKTAIQAMLAGTAGRGNNSSTHGTANSKPAHGPRPR